MFTAVSKEAFHFRWRLDFEFIFVLIFKFVFVCYYVHGTVFLFSVFCRQNNITEKVRSVPLFYDMDYGYLFFVSLTMIALSTPIHVLFPLTEIGTIVIVHKKEPLTGSLSSNQRLRFWIPRS